MLFLNIQTAIERAFKRRSQYYVTESKKLLKLRESDSTAAVDSPPWLFPKYFLVRESFSIMLRQFRLYEDALHAYDDVLTLFNELLPQSVDLAPCYVNVSEHAEVFQCECTEKPCDGPCDFGFCSTCIPGPPLGIDCLTFRQRFQGLLTPPMNELEFRRYIFANQLQLSIKLRLSMSGVYSAESAAASHSRSAAATAAPTASANATVASVKHSSKRKLSVGALGDLDDIIQLVRSFFAQMTRLMKPGGRHLSKFKRKICVSPETSIAWLLSATLDVREVLSEYIYIEYIFIYHNFCRKSKKLSSVGTWGTYVYNEYLSPMNSN